jgi:glycosyltransferase involved in cell wall biosynthesis
MRRNEAARVLILTPQFPYPPHQGTTIRNYNLIAGLARRHELHLLSFGDPEKSQGTPLAGLCRTVQVVPAPQRTTRQRLAGLFFSRLPDMAQRLPSAGYCAALDAILEREDPDVVEVEGIELAQYLFQVAARRGDREKPLLILDEHNAEYVLQQRAYETDTRQLLPWRRSGDESGGPGSPGTMGRGRRLAGAVYSLIQWRRLRRYERQACLAADRVVAVSDADAHALRSLVPGLEPVVVPNGVDIDHYTAPIPPLSERPGPEPCDLVFTGKMDFRPNVDSALWFAQQVLPLIRREAPDVRFWIVGQNPHPRLEPLRADPAVELTGWVEDVRPYIAAAAVYVVPLRIGGGTRLKVLEAMAMGKPIVSTAVGCEGFEVVDGQELLMADAPSEFAAAVLQLIRQPELRERLGRAAGDFAASRYDWHMIVPKLERIL